MSLGFVSANYLHFYNFDYESVKKTLCSELLGVLRMLKVLGAKDGSFFSQQLADWRCPSSLKVFQF